MENTNDLCMACMKHGLYPGGVCPHCGAIESQLRTAPHHLRPRSILSGRYVVGKAIGEGGFGITYVGWDTRLSVKAAIKEYYPNGFVTRNIEDGSTVHAFSGSEGEFFERERNRFIEEAKRLTRFGDLPGIVAVKDFFEENGTAYLVMEYVEGATLTTVLANMGGCLQEAHVLVMMEPLINSMIEVHKSGIIHRDIAPDNIMIRPDGNLKLIDFGAAREADSNGKSSVALMKHGYTPEEQYDTDRSRQGAWTDVYALSATIYRAIEGSAPPDANTRLRNDTFGGFTKHVSESTRFAVMKGLSVNPQNRWQNMGELLQALYPDVSIAATPNVSSAAPAPEVVSAPVQKTEQKNSRMKKWVIIGAGSLVAIFLAVFGIISLLSKPAIPDSIENPPNSVPADNQHTLEQTKPTAPPSTPTPTPVPVPVDPNTLGNTTSNILNGGHAVESDGWVYFVDPDDSSAICKMRVDGSDRQKLGDTSYAGYLNIAGDWIYYKRSGSLYKISTNGENEEEIELDYTNELYSIRKVLVAGDWIYFLATDYTDDSCNDLLYKTRTDGSGTMKLCDDYMYSYDFDEGWIYYIKEDEYGAVWRINAADSSGKEKLPLPLDEEDYRFAGDGSFNVAGGWIYFSDFNDKHRSCLYRIKTDGSSQTELDSTEDRIYAINVAGDWVYYVDSGYRQNDIYKIRTDGSNKMHIASDPGLRTTAEGLIVVGDWVYYINYGVNGTNLYRVNANGPASGEDAGPGETLGTATRFYDKYPDLADFGVVNLYPLYKEIDAAGGTFYVYDPSAKTNAIIIGDSMDMYIRMLGNNGFVGDSFEKPSLYDSVSLYFANKNDTCFYLFTNKVDDIPCIILYVFKGQDSFAQLNLFQSGLFTTAFPMYSDYSNLPDFGAFSGVRATTSKSDDSTTFSYDRSLLHENIWQELVDNYIKVLTSNGFYKSGTSTYVKGSTIAELRGINRSGNLTGTVFSVVVR